MMSRSVCMGEKEDWIGLDLIRLVLSCLYGIQLS